MSALDDRIDSAMPVNNRLATSAVYVHRREQSK